jgi:Mg/Co/Ni transporter MgtE
VGERRRNAVKPGYKRLTVLLPVELYAELRAVSEHNGVSRWIESVLREKLEAERRKRMLGLLPEPLREKLVKTAGSEDAAVHLLAKVVERGLAEIEEEADEDLIQQVLGDVHARERLSEVKRVSKSLSGGG